MLDRSPILADVPCVDCGYNLRTMPMGGRCPECGRDVRSSAFAPGARMAGARWLEAVRDGATWTLIGTLILCLSLAFTPMWMLGLSGPAGARWSFVAVLLAMDDGVSTR